jgi:hypothetical protein
MTKLSPDRWLEIRNLFVHGIVDESGRREYLSVDAIGKREGVNPSTIQKRSREENWVGARADFERRLRDQVDRERRKELAKEASEFDITSLRLAKGLQNEIAQIIIESQENRRRYKEALLNGRRPDPELRLLAPATLNSLASALSVAQKVGRLAMGESTENANVNVNDQRELEEARRIIDELARGKREDGPPVVH